jgi:hypothetical protein
MLGLLSDNRGHHFFYNQPNFSTNRSNGQLPATKSILTMIDGKIVYKDKQQ